MPDLYSILGLSRGANSAEIRAAYRALAKQSHPDVNAGDIEAEQRIKEINCAYETLGDPGMRAAYDLELARYRAKARRSFWKREHIVSNGTEVDDDFTNREIANKKYLPVSKLIDKSDARSRKIKSWSVTVSAAALAFSIMQKAPIFLLLAAFSAFAFWASKSMWEILLPLATT